MPDAYFIPDGDALVPTSIARGPWGEFISGQHVGGLLGRAMERSVNDPEMLCARLTVDLSRRVALKPVAVTTTSHRDGRRLGLIDAPMIQDGQPVALARALFLRPGEQPAGRVWSSHVPMPPMPTGSHPTLDDAPMQIFAYGPNHSVDGPTYDLSGWQQDGQKFVWLAESTPLVRGEATTAFTRAAIAGDVTSALTHFGDAGLHFINADYTLTLSRRPVGPYIGLAAMTHYSHNGVATGVATLLDSEGPLGSSVSVGLVNGGFRNRARPKTPQAETSASVEQRTSPRISPF